MTQSRRGQRFRTGHGSGQQQDRRREGKRSVHRVQNRIPCLPCALPYGVSMVRSDPRFDPPSSVRSTHL